MIGDYVKQKHSGLLLKVCDIEPPYIRSEGEGGQFHEDTIEPVPLLKLHLAKNGFETDEADTDFLYSDGYEVRLIFDEGEPSMQIEPYIFLKIDFAEKDMTMEIEYVHELQQALRLFGVDKEIKL